MKLINVRWLKKAKTNQVVFDVSIYELGDVLRDLRENKQSPARARLMLMLEEVWDRCEEPQ